MVRLEYKWLVGIAFVFGLFMDLLDTTIVNVALPNLQRDFNVKVDSIEWVVTAYLLSLAVFIPVSGYLADRFGSERIYLIAIALFTTASALCGLAQNETLLIAFRLLQGAGGGMMVPVGTAMLFREFPPEERATASSILAIPTVLAPTLGPLVGGALVEYLSWHWIFWVNLPIGVAGFLFSRHVLHEHREAEPGKFDLGGFLLSGAGFGSLLYGLSVAARPDQGIGSAQALGFIGLGVVLLAALAVVELHHTHPMLDFKLLRDPNFLAGNVLGFFMFTGMMGALFLYPLFLQNPLLKHMTPLQSGLTTFPQSLGVMLMRPFTGRLFNRLGGKPLILTGTILFALTTLVFTRLDVTTSDWLIRTTLVVRGMGMSLMLVTVQTMTFYSTTGPEMGRASSMFNSMRQVASSFGVAIMATVLSVRLGYYLSYGATQPQALVHAFDDAFWVAGVLAFCGVIVAFLVKVPHPVHAAAVAKTKPHPAVVLH